ncbi:hypothetical protein C2I18_04300 [Paenibacillus sp. PK3_47]|uniref:hypothetical protein n=1 Tax=Paenibacillus sp. PK3_47 TaxID=2072642 RepID=UPI00201DCFEB|nr:hypothetical protein [Paenibacillus sp. PK3_47]UQZ32848.1 hypothetical protein C2I18_04300 [Paenibacillus sp. PK3_47]
MKFLSRLLFIVSLLVLTVFALDPMQEQNKTLLYTFMAGFTGTFITSFFTDKSTFNLLIRCLSAIVVAGFLLYIFVFGYLWSAADRP